MSNIPIKLNIPPLPAGFSGNMDAYHAWLSENITGEIPSSSGAFISQIGGGEPTSDVGIWFDTDGSGEIFYYDSEKGRYRTFNEVGEIRIWPVGDVGDALPSNFLDCDGTTVAIEDYPFLADVLLETGWQLGDEGDDDFRLPDFRGRYLVGVGAGKYKTTGATDKNLRVYQPYVYGGCEWPRNLGGSPPPSAVAAASDVLAINPATPTNRIGNGSFSQNSTAGPTHIIPPHTPVRVLIRYR